MDSNDAAVTLADFGFRADLAASAGAVNGDVEWRPVADEPWLAGLRGTLSMRLTDGRLRADATDLAGPARPFALFAVPALMSGLDAPGGTAVAARFTKEQHELHFARLEADFELRDGQATTADLHFDGDAEILMRGRIGLVSRDYDQQVWGATWGGAAAAAVRRFGATPRVAAAWLSLRDLFAGGGTQDRSRAVLRLQGTWDDPMVVVEN